ncbi:MAG: Prolipoprotein diacylglyceryl transferase [Pseudomonadota bacterium]|jgi:hypothetical protein
MNGSRVVEVAPGWLLFATPWTLHVVAGYVLALAWMALSFRRLRIPVAEAVLLCAVCLAFGAVGTGLFAWATVGRLSGKVLYGGLLGALLAGGVCWEAWLRHRLPMRPLFDEGMVALCLLFGITRYGCHLEGCCHGTPSPGGWPSVIYPHDTPGFAPAPSLRGIPLHPAALYECVGLLALAVVGGLLLRLRPVRAGHAGWGMLGGYAVLRLVVELVRADERGWESFPLSPSQVISLAILVVGVADLGLGWTRWPTFPWRKSGLGK